MIPIAVRRSGLTVVVWLMKNSVLTEVDDTSILRTGLSTAISILSTGYQPFGSCLIELPFGRIVDQTKSAVWRHFWQQNAFFVGWLSGTQGRPRPLDPKASGSDGAAVPASSIIRWPAPLTDCLARFHHTERQLCAFCSRPRGTDPSGTWFHCCAPSTDRCS